MVFPTPPPYDPISTETLPNQIGLAQDFFREKLRKNHDEALVEDEDLPQKQRFPKPRLPPTGKISSLEEDSKLQAPVGKLKLQMPEPREHGNEPEKVDGHIDGAMISPESLTAN
jgi:transcriptional activator SPT7